MAGTKTERSFRRLVLYHENYKRPVLVVLPCKDFYSVLQFRENVD